MVRQVISDMILDMVRSIVREEVQAELELEYVRIIVQEEVRSELQSFYEKISTLIESFSAHLASPPPPSPTPLPPPKRGKRHIPLPSSSTTPSEEKGTFRSSPSTTISFSSTTSGEKIHHAMPAIDPSFVDTATHTYASTDSQTLGPTVDPPADMVYFF